MCPDSLSDERTVAAPVGPFALRICAGCGEQINDGHHAHGGRLAPVYDVPALTIAHLREVLHDLLMAVWRDTEQAGLESGPDHLKRHTYDAWLRGRDDTVEYMRTESIDPLREMVDAGEFDRPEDR